MNEDSKGQFPAAAGQHPTGNPDPGPGSITGSSDTPSRETATTEQQPHKRRRRFSGVTPNACRLCKKKRTKCNGQQPCSRCDTQKDVDCIYDIPVRRSKEDLRAEVNGLQAEVNGLRAEVNGLRADVNGLRQCQRSSNQVLAALILPELSEGILMRLRAGESIESLSEWLRRTLYPHYEELLGFGSTPPSVPALTGPRGSEGGYVGCVNNSTKNPITATQQQDSGYVIPETTKQGVRLGDNALTWSGSATRYAMDLDPTTTGALSSFILRNIPTNYARASCSQHLRQGSETGC